MNDLKEKGARIIIGEFFETAARQVMCDAYKMGMTQANGYVWFLPGWYQNDWYNLDTMRAANQTVPNCTTAEMVEVSLFLLLMTYGTFHSGTVLAALGCFWFYIFF